MTDPVNSLIEGIRNFVRSLMTRLAKELNTATRGSITPTMVTLTGLLAHVPIALLIAQQKFILAAVLLIVFGLFDALDGALARIQNSSSPIGVFLDSTTDRIKEILLYVGITFALVDTGQVYAAVWAVAACGIALFISYINAWGEVTLGLNNKNNHQTNKRLRNGIMSYDVRIFMLILGLLLNQLAVVVAILALLGVLTATQRIFNVLSIFRSDSDKN